MVKKTLDDDDAVHPENDCSVFAPPRIYSLGKYDWPRSASINASALGLARKADACAPPAPSWTAPRFPAVYALSGEITRTSEPPVEEGGQKKEREKKRQRKKKRKRGRKLRFFIQSARRCSKCSDPGSCNFSGRAGWSGDDSNPGFLKTLVHFRLSLSSGVKHADM
ncbi:hypothetical protein Q8A73_016716 [Channa argus]|nr:hypothetical protein Q8A73_016716 [Channa argus]